VSALDDFLRRHGIESFTMRRIRAGRNSEVSHIADGEKQCVLKHYYRQPQDPRDRLGVEYGFVTFLAEVGVTCVPKPLGKDDALGYALYSLLPGERPAVLTAELVTQAARFIASLQEHRFSVAAEALPAAADACFNLREHVALMTTRVARLAAVRPESDAERAAHAFVVERVAPLGERLQQRLAREAGDAEPLPPGARILSPSDFGFHNTLLHEGRLSFVDFEYAGFDDPAKLLCDFRCQPELPVSEGQGQQFCDELSRALPNGEAIVHRAELVLPVHRLKWCCILLNELRSEDRKRRMHASGAVEPEALLAAQLDKAQRYFDEHLASLT
jgi:hypothetical protein